ncbi:MAG: phosphoglucomutase (alpha-D-glucose-1,6-bisphosphate-dependent) [Deltaproteobacteria bacterium]|nr:phosphoglucomutase (alpha-D-glucose-1,6-bisphosphate-dependent) [Deltaproteobacteria bacterium]
MARKQHPLAGLSPSADMLIDVDALCAAYYDRKPDAENPAQRVAFGTSGHRGSSFSSSFNEAHILATTQAICEYRAQKGIEGPLFLGKDTHALSLPAEKSALEVLAGNGVLTVIQGNGAFTPTPAISHAILRHNRNPGVARADGIVVTPSHNPPDDGGFKYNPPSGGPADTDVTGWIEKRANQLMGQGNVAVKRVSYETALRASTTKAEDLILPYVDDLEAVIDLDVIRNSGLRIGADPLGGASVDYWRIIGERLKLNLEVVNPTVDPRFAFMRVDYDGKIRMDCSSPAAMASLVELKDRYGIAFGNDADADRHGIVAPSVGLLNPNHFLCVAIDYLCTHRPGWSADAGIGKTLVSSALVDRVAAKNGRRVIEVPVGFKWFVGGLCRESGDAPLCFGGEESAGASFLRRDGGVWTTDKDGLILCLLAAEITARTGRDPGQHYRALAAELGDPAYIRIDQPAPDAVRAALKKLSPESVSATTLAGDPITARLVRAPGNDAAIGGLKVVTQNGWFAARPSGTEPIYKIYAESFKGPAHLELIVEEARELVARAAG